MEFLKTGDPCPCCGQPIKTKDKDTLLLLSWIGRYRRLPSPGEIGEIVGTEDSDG